MLGLCPEALESDISHPTRKPDAYSPMDRTSTPLKYGMRQFPQHAHDTFGRLAAHPMGWRTSMLDYTPP